jgi:hypothetical protein
MKTPEPPESPPASSHERIFYVVIAALGRPLFFAGALWLVIGGLGVLWIANQSRPGMNPAFSTDTSDMPRFIGFAFEAFLVTAMLLWLLELIRLAAAWARSAGRGS